jgi:hypothetical protein
MGVVYCLNGCFGYGLCGGNDKCICYLCLNGDVVWIEYDCFFCICLKFVVWVAVAIVVNEVYFFVECFNKGLCNRKIGECDCFDNYDGIVCEWIVCLGDCFNYGFCYMGIISVIQRLLPMAMRFMF